MSGVPSGLQPLRLQLVDRDGRPLGDESIPIDIDALIRSGAPNARMTDAHGRTFTVEVQKNDNDAYNGNDEYEEEETEEDDTDPYYTTDEGAAYYGGGRSELATDGGWFGEVRDWYDQSARPASAHKGSSSAPPADAVRTPMKPSTNATNVVAGPNTGKSTAKESTGSTKSSQVEKWRGLKNNALAAAAAAAAGGGGGSVALHHKSSLQCVEANADHTRAKFAPLAVSRFSTVSVRAGPSPGLHRVVVFGGYNGRGPDNELYEFQPHSSLWRRLEGRGHVPTGCYAHSAVAYPDPFHPGQSRMIVIGGVGLGGVACARAQLAADDAAACARFDWLLPSTNVVPRAAGGFSNTGLSSAATALMKPPHGQRHAFGDGRQLSRGLPLPSAGRSVVQLIADSNSVTALQSTTAERAYGVVPYMYEYRFTTSEWRRIVSNLEIPIAAHTSVVVNGAVVYSFGGLTESLRVSDQLMALDVGPSSLEYGARLVEPASGSARPRPRFGHTACVYERHMLVFGGCDEKNETLGDLWAFDVVSCSWEVLPIIGECPARMAHGAAVTGHRMLLLGGFRNFDDTMPFGGIHEINLAPADKGFVSREVTCQPGIPRLAHLGVAPCDDGLAFVLFGGVGYRKDKPKEHAASSDVKGGSGSRPIDVGGKSAAPSAPPRSASPPNSARRSSSASAQKKEAHLNNWTYIVAFPRVRRDKSPGAGSDKSSDKDGEGKSMNAADRPLSEGFLKFLKRTSDGALLKRRQLVETQEQITEDARSDAEPPLFLTPAEVSELLDAADHLHNTYSRFKTADIQSNVPDVAERVKHIEVAQELAKKARENMKGMRKAEEKPVEPESGSDGAALGVLASTKLKAPKKRRRKTGEKASDFSAVKPFRQILIMSLLKRTLRHQTSLLALNKSLTTTVWPGKRDYIAWTEDTMEALQDLLKIIKRITSKYIDDRMEALMQGAVRKKINLQRLTETVRKIQHDKIWKPAQHGRSREQEKQKRVEEDRRKRGGSSDAGKKKKNRRRAHSAGRRAVRSASQPRPVMVTSLTTEDHRVLLKASEVARQAVAAVLARCAPPGTDGGAAAPAAAPAAATVVAGQGPQNESPAVASEQPLVVVASTVAPPNATAELTPMQRSDAAKAVVARHCSEVTGGLQSFDRFLEEEAKATTEAHKQQLQQGGAAGLIRLPTTSGSISDSWLVTIQKFRALCNAIDAEVVKLRIPDTGKDKPAAATLQDDETVKAAAEMHEKVRGLFQRLKFIFFAKQGIPATKLRERAPDRSVKPPAAHPPPSISAATRAPAASAPAASGDARDKQSHARPLSAPPASRSRTRSADVVEIPSAATFAVGVERPQAGARLPTDFAHVRPSLPELPGQFASWNGASAFSGGLPALTSGATVAPFVVPCEQQPVAASRFVSVQPPLIQRFAVEIPPPRVLHYAPAAPPPEPSLPPQQQQDAVASPPTFAPPAVSEAITCETAGAAAGAGGSQAAGASATATAAINIRSEETPATATTAADSPQQQQRRVSLEAVRPPSVVAPVSTTQVPTMTAGGGFGASIDPLQMGTSFLSSVTQRLLAQAPSEDYFFTATYGPRPPAESAGAMFGGRGPTGVADILHGRLPPMGPVAPPPATRHAGGLSAKPAPKASATGSASVKPLREVKPLFSDKKLLTPGEKHILMMRQKNATW